MMTAVRDRIHGWFNQGLKAVDPARVTTEALTRVDPGTGDLVVLAIGKAAVAMASSARDCFGDRIAAGLIVAKQGQLDGDVDGFVAIEAAHPVPDMESLRAGEVALEMVSGLGADDTVIALISGGGSALLEHPVESISLMDMQVTTELLMYAGAGIHDLNAVRKALSAIKGGGLRRAIGDARCITLMLSDVLGNDHSVIASGPTVPEPTNRNRAWQVLEEYRVQDNVPESVRRWLNAELPPTEPIDTSRDIREIIADNATLIAAVQEAIAADGLNVEERWAEWRDDAGELAHIMLRDCREAASSVDVLIGGGEATSIVRGSGSGGRNTETALVAALAMTDDDWTIASLASDGDDGNSRAAGAIVDSSTVSIREVAVASLAISDSAGFLSTRDALVVTGQTGTNVNDVYIAVRSSAISGEE